MYLILGIGSTDRHRQSRSLGVETCSCTFNVILSMLKLYFINTPDQNIELAVQVHLSPINSEKNP